MVIQFVQNRLLYSEVYLKINIGYNNVTNWLYEHELLLFKNV